MQADDCSTKSLFINLYIFMKKIYTLAAMVAMAFCAQAQIANVDMTPDLIPGKYMLADDCQPLITQEGVGFNYDNIVVLDLNGSKNFTMENFFFNKENADTGAYESYPGTWYAAGEWANYPGVTNIQFLWDNAMTYVYNPNADNEAYAYLWHSANSFRLLPKQDAAGNTILYLWPNNELNWNETEGNTTVVSFPKTGAFNAQTNPEGTFHMVRLPQHKTITKRALSGDWTVTGIDSEGNEVRFPVKFTAEGTNYVMTGFFGDESHSITFTWDGTDAGIRADYIYEGTTVTETDSETGETSEYEEATYMVESYALNGKLYLSFTENGEMSFDHPIYYYSADDDKVAILYNGKVSKGIVDGIHTATTQPSEARAYDLQGRVLSMQNRHSIAVKDGRKVLR